MLKCYLLAAGLLYTVTCLSQQLPLINSGNVLESGKASYDSGNYKAAIKKYLTISERDTNYVAAMAELAITYLADGDYVKTIETCDKALEVPSEHRAHLLRSKAIALDKKGELDKSVALFERSLEAYPMDPLLIYNYGITLFNAKQYPRAKELFFRALSINPFHGGSHRTLSRIAMLEGRKVHAMLAMGLYLSINPSDNEHLVMINNFVLNQVTDEGTITGTGPNSYEKLDQIVRAKMAMDKNFESKYSFDYAIVRQFEMIFQQIDMGGGESNDSYRNFYTGLYKAFRDKGYLDPFIYNLIKSTGNEQVKKWLKKNEKTLNAFYTGAGELIREKRYHPYLPESFGLGNDYSANYNDQGRLISVGKELADGTMIGKCYFFHPNMERSAEGTFDKDEKKSGIWKYYRNTGSLSKEENWANGEMTYYHPEGTKYQHFFMVKDSIEGNAEVFYPCGAIKEKYIYKDNKRHGRALNYFANGQVQSDYNYKSGKLEGEYRTFYENGKLMSVAVYKDGIASGPYKKYFANGKNEITGQYVNDEREGEWNYYYFNGARDRKGVYKAGMGVGEWLFYNERGELIEKRNFDQKGNFEGDNTFYVNGKVYYVRTYKNNVIIRYVFFDDTGKQIGKFEKDNGNFALKMYYPTGQLSGEGNLKGGKLDGPWKYYYRYGGLKSEFIYKNGELEGKGSEFYPDGSKKSIASYTADNLHGYYQTFHSNGKTQEEGWFQDGRKQQRWISYHPDGSVEDDEFYLNGTYVAHGLEYAPDGKLISKRVFDDEGNIESLILYNPDGKPGSIQKDSGTKQIFETKFAKGKTQSHFELMCGAYYGPVTRYYPDGKILYSYSLINGKREGKYEMYDVRNQLERTGNYIDGWAEGEWKGYENGKLDYRGKYLNNNFDSTWTYYFADGRVSSFSNYLRGERDGLTSTRNKEGGEAVEKIYQNDDLIAFRTMKADGKWSDWTRFTGNASIVSYYTNGSKATEEEYKNGFVSGVKRHYYSNGKVQSEFNFRYGDYEGPFIVYHANGKVKHKGEYKGDEFHGKVEWFNEDGTPLTSENYLHGLRIGKAVVYQKGVKSREYTFWGINVYE